jgi:hypothetical protein
MAVVTAHPRAMYGNLATMETDFALGPAPAITNAASATIMRRAGELLRVLAKHLLDGSDPGRQTEALEGAGTRCVRAVTKLSGVTGIALPVGVCASLILLTNLASFCQNLRRNNLKLY